MLHDVHELRFIHTGCVLRCGSAPCGTASGVILRTTQSGVTTMLGGRLVPRRLWVEYWSWRGLLARKWISVATQTAWDDKKVKYARTRKLLSHTD